MTKFKCLRCGATFNEPQFIIHEHSTFLGNNLGEYDCPECGSEDIQEGEECALCGGWTDGSRFCRECRTEVMERFNELLEIHFSEAEIDLINEETDGERIGK